MTKILKFVNVRNDLILILYLGVDQVYANYEIVALAPARWVSFD